MYCDDRWCHAPYLNSMRGMSSRHTGSGAAMRCDEWHCLFALGKSPPGEGLRSEVNTWVVLSIATTDTPCACGMNSEAYMTECIHGGATRTWNVPCSVCRP